jgi:hypothetical protein
VIPLKIGIIAAPKGATLAAFYGENWVSIPKALEALGEPVVDVNSEGAYADQGMTLRNYPRFMPTPYKSIAPQENRLVLEPWRKNMKLYPQTLFPGNNLKCHITSRPSR